MIKKLFLPLIFLLLFVTATQIKADESYERVILVFKPNTTKSQKYNFINQNQMIWGKDLNLINAQAVQIPKSLKNFISKHPSILRIDQDVQVQALENNSLINQTTLQANNICDWFPTWPGCAPKASPSPTPKPSPTSTPKASPSVSPSPSLNPSPTSLPSTSPSPASTPSNTPTPSSSSSTSPIPVASPSPSPASGQTIPWGISKINAPPAWGLTSGENIKVAVIDTGINRSHPDLADNLAGCVNFINSTRTCEDDNGHGTHVSGIIAALNNDIGVVGVAPHAKIYALKVLNSQGSGYLSDIIEALDWSVTNNMQIINMSLGTSSNITSLHDAVVRVRNAGIVQIAAAGNSGPYSNSVNYPAKYAEVMAVSATDTSDAVPSWSSRGTEVDLAAPGVNILSTYPTNNYTTMSGTSMATPYVVGVAALRLASHSGESVSTLETILKNNTDSLPFDATLVGSGRVNAYKVVMAN